VSAGIIGELREKLRVLERETGGLLESRDECCGLTSSQCHTMLELSGKGKVSLVDLATALGLDASTLSRTIQGLVILGLVHRAASEKDRRRVEIVLSDQGRSVVGQIETLNNGYFEKVLAEIPADRQAALLESLNLLTGAVKRVNDATGCCRPEAGS
jgi:DNA-binding MarR family transcriptional regulator